MKEGGTALNTQQANVKHHTDGLKPGRLPGFLPSSLPTFQSFILLLALFAAGMMAGTARGTEYFVATNGADTGNNGKSWGQPFKTISNAVAQADADVVTVSNGTYNIGAEILLSKVIRVRSFQGGLSGASNTIVKQTASGQSFTRVFRTAHTGAVIEGLTITGGSLRANSQGGGGVYMAGGLVRDCIVTGNSAGGASTSGGNIYMDSTGSTVSNCVITAGYAGGRTPTTAGGCGIFAGGNNKILNCQVLNNYGDGYSMAPGILAQPTDLIRNCLIAGNNLPARPVEANSGKGAGIYGGKVENCTIVSNTCAYGRVAGGVLDCAYVSNSIVYGNWRWGDTAGSFKIADNYSGGSFAYSCATPLPAGEGNVDVDPLFVHPAAGDYRLQVAPVRSPCINAGTNLDWMATAVDMDGKPRIMLGTVDMGAFEYWPVTPLIRNAGVANITDKTAVVRGDIYWLGLSEVTVLLFHGPSDGGTDRQAWAHETRLMGARGIGLHDITLSHEAVGRTWLYRCCATNRHGAAWADSTDSFMLAPVEVKVTGRQSTEEKPAAFVISRPATATNGPLAVYYTLGGTGRNGEDFDPLESPAVIPVGASEVRLPVIPNFNMGETRPKGVELTLAPGGYVIGPNSKASIATKPQ